MDLHNTDTRELVQHALATAEDPETVADRVADWLHYRISSGGRPAPGVPRRMAMPVFRWVAVAVAVLVLGNLVAARALPGYALALADAPVIGGISTPLLQLAGLAPSQVSPAGSTATVDGQTIKVLGGFADTARTVVIVQVDGRNSPPSKTAAGYDVLASLTDQYGHRYSQTVAGQDLWFQPLVGPATKGPVHLTLHVTQLNMWSASSPGRPSTQSEFTGNWVLGLTVMQQPDVAPPLPSPVTVNGTTYAVTSIKISGTEVSVNWRASGGSEIAQLYKLDYQPGGPDVAPGSPEQMISMRYFMPAILNPDGSYAGPTGNSNNSGFGIISPTLITGRIQYVLQGPGRYLIAMGRPPVVTFPITIP